MELEFKSEIPAILVGAPFKHDKANAVIEWKLVFKVRPYGITRISVLIKTIVLNVSYKEQWQDEQHLETATHELDVTEWEGIDYYMGKFHWSLKPTTIHIRFKRRKFNLYF